MQQVFFLTQLIDQVFLQDARDVVATNLRLAGAVELVYYRVQFGIAADAHSNISLDSFAASAWHFSAYILLKHFADIGELITYS